MKAPSRKDIQYMKSCVANAQIFSTCSRRQYYSIIVAPDGRIAGTGYNGVPSGFQHCVDGGCPRAQLPEGVGHGSPYGNCSAVHAEGNACLHSDRSLRDGATLYVNGPPCWDCAKLIANSGVARVCFLADDAYENFGHVRILLGKAGVELVQIERELL